MGKTKDKPRNGGEWTEARFNSFIKGTLRQASRKWGPIHEAKRDAREHRGQYRCAGCDGVVPGTVRSGRKRENNVFVDHINPIVDPEVGFVSWDDVVERMFCEKDNLQLLCKDCHDEKSKDERTAAAAARKKRKLDDK